MHIHSILQVINNSWVSLLLRRSLGRLHVLHLHLSSAHCGQCQWPMRKPLTAHGPIHECAACASACTTTVSTQQSGRSISQTRFKDAQNLWPWQKPAQMACLISVLLTFLCSVPHWHEASASRSVAIHVFDGDLLQGRYMPRHLLLAHEYPFHASVVASSFFELHGHSNGGAQSKRRLAQLQEV